MLSDDERAVFKAFSIFAGGFTIEMAAAVSGHINDIVVLDLLSSLVDKSLVQAESLEGSTRYRLLESTRQYAFEKLTAAGDHESVAQAHVHAFLALAERLDLLYDTTADREWIAQAQPEMENWRAALEWSLGSRHDIGLGQRLVGTMHSIWLYLATSEGRRWVRAALATADDATPACVIASLQLAEAQLCAALVQHKASLDAAQRVLEYLNDADDPAVPEAQRLAGRAGLLLGRAAEAEALLLKALTSA